MPKPASQLPDTQVEPAPELERRTRRSFTLVYNAFTSEALWTAAAADARGHLTAFTLGNGVETTQSYDPVYGRIESIHAAKAGFVIEDQTYAFDVLGNLRERHDNRAGVDEYFCYDTLNRLVDNGLSSCSGTGSTHLTYDLHGNVLSKTGIGSYAYGAGNAGPHAVTQAGGNTYHYDANGNLTSVSGATPRTVSYTPFGKPALITGGGHSVAVIYGPNQHRVRRIDNSSVATTYVGGLYEHVGERQRIYLHDFAVLETGTGGAGLTYLHRDHLGSIVAKSDTQASNDDHVEWLAYAAWGKRLDESWAGTELGPTDQPNTTARGFTGHEHLDPVGLIHMNGRVYDPAIGRFLSADPLVQAPFNTQSYNRYSYVFNNPLSFTDPSGFQCVRGEEGDCLVEIVVKAKRLPTDEMVVTGERSCPTGATCMSGKTYGQSNFVNLTETDIWQSIFAGMANSVANTLGSTARSYITMHGGEAEWIPKGDLFEPKSGYFAAEGEAVGEGLQALAGGKGLGRALAKTAVEKGLLLTPKVSSPKLQNIINDLYKGTTNPKRVGNGTTMDAIRHEVTTGEKVGGVFHSQKGTMYARGIENWLRSNPNAPYRDRVVAQSILDDLRSAMGSGQ